MDESKTHLQKGNILKYEYFTILRKNTEYISYNTLNSIKLLINVALTFIFKVKIKEKKKTT